MEEFPVNANSHSAYFARIGELEVPAAMKINLH